MSLENPIYINDFVASNPPQEDLRREGDDHLRNMKEATLNTFPNLTGAVLASQAELNLLVGVTSLPNLEIETITLNFTTALAGGANRTFTEAAVGVLSTDSLMPTPGSPFSSFPGLLLTAWRGLTDQIEVVVVNVGSIEIPISTSLALPFVVLR